MSAAGKKIDTLRVLGDYAEELGLLPSMSARVIAVKILTSTMGDFGRYLPGDWSEQSTRAEKMSWRQRAKNAYTVAEAILEGFAEAEAEAKDEGGQE